MTPRWEVFETQTPAERAITIALNQVSLEGKGPRKLDVMALLFTAREKFAKDVDGVPAEEEA